MTITSIVTIAGAKGGVGKTTTSINLATALAAPDREVAVVELDLAMANVVDFLSLPREKSDPTIHDVLAGDADPLSAAYFFEDNVAAVPSGTTLDGYVDADLDRLPEVLKAYASRFDVIVLDTGAGLNRAVVDPMRLADGTVVVSTPRVASVRDADKTVTLSQRVDTPVYGLVLAQSGTGQSPGPERISEFLDVDLLGHVPDDEAVPASQDNGVPVVTAAPESPAGSTYRRIAENLLLELSVYSDPEDDAEATPTDAATGEETLIEQAVDERSAPQASGPTPAIRSVESTEATSTPVVDGGRTSSRPGSSNTDPPDDGDLNATEKWFDEKQPDESPEPEASTEDGSEADDRSATADEPPGSPDRNGDPVSGEGSSDDSPADDGSDTRMDTGGETSVSEGATGESDPAGAESAGDAESSVADDESEKETGFVARIRRFF